MENMENLENKTLKQLEVLDKKYFGIMSEAEEYKNWGEFTINQNKWYAVCDKITELESKQK